MVICILYENFTFANCLEIVFCKLFGNCLFADCLEIVLLQTIWKFFVSKLFWNLSFIKSSEIFVCKLFCKCLVVNYLQTVWKLCLQTLKTLRSQTVSRLFACKLFGNCLQSTWKPFFSKRFWNSSFVNHLEAVFIYKLYGKYPVGNSLESFRLETV